MNDVNAPFVLVLLVCLGVYLATLLFIVAVVLL